MHYEYFFLNVNNFLNFFVNNLLYINRYYKRSENEKN